MKKIKCITFDKAAQAAIPDHIKDRMKRDRDQAEAEKYGHEENEPYCNECGSDDLAYLDQYANGSNYKCKNCSHDFMWNEKDDQ